MIVLGLKVAPPAGDASLWWSAAGGAALSVLEVRTQRMTCKYSLYLLKDQFPYLLE
jgi:hypothetical protein